MIKVNDRSVLDDRTLRDFLFFLSDVHPVSLEDSLIGALATQSSWSDLSAIIKKARKEDRFVRSLKHLYIYIHVPFCERLCNFCHCSRVLLKQSSELDNFVTMLQQQIEYFRSIYHDMSGDSICFGGGTPSLLTESQVEKVLDTVDGVFPSAKRKIYLEVHPSSWNASKLSIWAERGLYRLSIGVQSFEDKVLRMGARYHDEAQVLWCLRSAIKAKVPIVNVDIIAGLPGQTVNGLKEDIQRLIDVGIKHIHLQPYVSLSWSQLCAPEESVRDFLRRRDTLMSVGVETLSRAGYRCQGLGGFVKLPKIPESNKDFRHIVRTVVAALGPFAIGEFPGAVYYAAGRNEQSTGMPTLKAVSQDFGYVMSKYAILSLIGGLDENVFQELFGVCLNEHCGDGLRFLQRQGLLEYRKGVWKFSGEWEFRRVREYVALSRVLFCDELLMKLWNHYQKEYDLQQDHENGEALLRSYTQDWLTTLYYQRQI